MIESSTWDAHFASPGGRRKWPNEELVRYVADRQFGRVVEVGCGDGANLRFLAEHAEMVCGIDDSAVALHYAARSLGKHRRKVRLSRGSILSYDRADGTADLVVDCMVSQHIPWNDHIETYRKYRSMLRAGGCVWIYHLTNETQTEKTHMSRSLQNCRSLGLFPSLDFFCLPSLASLASTIESAGFSRPVRRWVAKGYPDGQVAHYAVLDAVAE